MQNRLNFNLKKKIQSYYKSRYLKLNCTGYFVPTMPEEEYSFDVCLSGVNINMVQDFRFLCPNGTAFDQEAQICADWGDVDCEQATLYYSSDDFDLYRINSGFESKRAPLAEEDEALFHLQRAESGDIRNSKQTIKQQRFRSKQSQDYTTHFPHNSKKPSFDSNFHGKPTKVYSFPIQINNVDNLQKVTTNTPFYSKPTGKSQSDVHTTKPQFDYIQEDEIFKGSHSSNFFNNRNNGKEEDLVDFPKAPSMTKARQINRGQDRRNYHNNNILPQAAAGKLTTTTTQEPRVITAAPFKNTFYSNKNNSQILTLQSSFRSDDLLQYAPQRFRTSELASKTTRAYDQYNLTPIQAQFQQYVQPTTYNPPNNKDYKFKPTTNSYDINVPPNLNFSQSPKNSNPNPFYNEQFENNFESYNRPHYPKDNLEKNNTQIITTFTNTRQDFAEFNRNNSLIRKKGQRTDVTRIAQNVKTTFEESKNEDKQHLRKHQFSYENVQRTAIETPQLSVRPLELQKIHRVLKNQTTLVEPEFKLRNISNNRHSINPELLGHSENIKTRLNNNLLHLQPHKLSPAAPVPYPNKHISSDQNPRGKSRSTPLLNRNSNAPSVYIPKKAEFNNLNKYQPITRTNENQTPSTTGKQFSTHVPKDQYYPTTFRPTTYKKQINGYNTNYEKVITRKYSNILPTIGTVATIRPQNLSDQNDGQYHPELYETDFIQHHSKENSIQKVTGFPQPTKSNHAQKYNDFSEEDEFLKTAHSLNIAAGTNQLRAEKAEKQKQLSTTPQYKTTLAPTTARPTLTKTTSSRKPRVNEDTSYDYAYYDSSSESPHDYAEYDVISEFGKTKKQ